VLLSEETFENTSETDETRGSPRKSSITGRTLSQTRLIHDVLSFFRCRLICDILSLLRREETDLLHSRNANELSYGRLRLIDNTTLSHRVTHDCYASRDKSTGCKSRCSYRSPPAATLARFAQIAQLRPDLSVITAKTYNDSCKSPCEILPDRVTLDLWARITRNWEFATSAQSPAKRRNYVCISISGANVTARTFTSPSSTNSFDLVHGYATLISVSRGRQLIEHTRAHMSRKFTGNVTNISHPVSMKTELLEITRAKSNANLLDKLTFNWKCQCPKPAYNVISKASICNAVYY